MVLGGGRGRLSIFFCGGGWKLTISLYTKKITSAFRRVSVDTTVETNDQKKLFHHTCILSSQGHWGSDVKAPLLHGH